MADPILSLGVIGLILICIGWIFQLVYGWDKKKAVVSKSFLLLYIIGVIFLAVDGFSSKLITLAVLNTISFILALILFLKIPRK